MKIDESLAIKDLQILGLTQNEAKALIALIKVGGESDAPKIAVISGVPRTKIYQILLSLEKKNIIITTKIEGSSNRYKLISSPESIVKGLEAELIEPITNAAKRTADEILRLSSVIKETSENGIHQVWVIKGFDSITHILTEKIAGAKNKIITNAFPMFLIPVLPALLESKQKGVEINIIMLDEERDLLPPKYQNVFSNNIIGLSSAQLSRFLETIPIDSSFFNFKGFLELFKDLLAVRPNILLIDPNSINPIGVLYLQSRSDPKEATAIQVENKDFIDFINKLINIIFKLAGVASTWQDQYLKLNN